MHHTFKHIERPSPARAPFLLSATHQVRQSTLLPRSPINATIPEADFAAIPTSQPRALRHYVPAHRPFSPTLILLVSNHERAHRPRFASQKPARMCLDRRVRRPLRHEKRRPCLPSRKGVYDSCTLPRGPSNCRMRFRRSWPEMDGKASI